MVNIGVSLEERLAHLDPTVVDAIVEFCDGDESRLSVITAADLPNADRVLASGLRRLSPLISPSLIDD